MLFFSPKTALTNFSSSLYQIADISGLSSTTTSSWPSASRSSSGTASTSRTPCHRYRPSSVRRSVPCPTTWRGARTFRPRSGWGPCTSSRAGPMPPRRPRRRLATSFTSRSYDLSPSRPTRTVLSFETRLMFGSSRPWRPRGRNSRPVPLSPLLPVPPSPLESLQQADHPRYRLGEACLVRQGGHLCRPSRPAVSRSNLDRLARGVAVEEAGAAAEVPITEASAATAEPPRSVAAEKTTRREPLGTVSHLRHLLLTLRAMVVPGTITAATAKCPRRTATHMECRMGTALTIKRYLITTLPWAWLHQWANKGLPASTASTPTHSGLALDMASHHIIRCTVVILI